MSSTLIYFYHITEPNNKINKSIPAQPIYNYTFPHILFDRNDFKLKISYNSYFATLNFNYAYVERFNKYYFVEKPILIAENLWNIDLKLDYLTTYKDLIYTMTGTIVKSDNINKYFESANINSDVRKNEELIYFDNPFNETLQNVLLTVASRGSY